MNNKILQVKKFKKSFGNIEIIKGISFDVLESEIFALIGPNGAGKSTTLRTIATILSYEEGEIIIDGENLKQNPDKIRSIISYLPEEAGAYRNLTGKEYLKLMASLYAKNISEEKEYLAFAIEISGLKDKLRNKISTYSKGMTRKLLLSRAIMTKPKLAILDEPTSGLDIINAMEIRKLIRSLTDQGMSVLLSSHNMLEIEFLAHRVGIINKGEILEMGTIKELKSKHSANNLEEVFMGAVK